MDLRQLRYFVAVADHGSFTAAADDLSVAQSSVSHGVRRLEEILGVELIDRSAQRARLSEAGHVLLPQARIALRAAETAQATIEEMKEGLRGIVRMRTVDLRHLVVLPDLLSSFHRRHPEVQLHVAQSGNSAQHLDAVHDGQADFAIAVSADPPSPGLEFQILRDDPLMLAVSTGHHLAGRQSAVLAEVATEVFAVAAPGSPSRTILTRTFAEAGLDVRIGFEVDFVPDLMQLIAAGSAIALAPSVVIDKAPGVTGLTLLDVNHTNTLVLARARTRRLGAAVNAFTAELIAALGDATAAPLTVR